MNFFSSTHALRQELDYVRNDRDDLRRRLTQTTKVRDEYHAQVVAERADNDTHRETIKGYQLLNNDHKIKCETIRRARDAAITECEYTKQSKAILQSRVVELKVSLETAKAKLVAVGELL